MNHTPQSISLEDFVSRRLSRLDCGRHPHISTCRNFDDTILDLTWRVQSSLAPLIRTLPSDAYAESGGECPTLVLTRPLVESDLASLSTYAQRVQIFNHLPDIHDTCMPRDSFIGFDVLNELCKFDDVLFPNLRELRWMDPNPDLAPYVALFIGPALREFSCLLHPQCSAASLTYLELVPRDLEKLLVGMPAEDCDITNHWRVDAVSRMILRLKELTSISCCIPLPPLVHRHIFTSKILKVVEILDDVGKIIHVLQAFSMECAFFTPTQLRLHGHYEACSRVIQLLRPRRLANLTIALLSSRVPDKLSTCRFFQSIVAYCDHRMLRRLEISYLGDDLAPFSVDEEMLRTLRTLQNLDSFETNLDLLLTNELLARLALSWSKIQTLYLGRCIFAKGNAVTLEGLVSLAKFCPLLKKLRILLHASMGDAFSVNVMISSCWSGNGNLHFLDVGMSTIDPQLGKSSLADMLLFLFPNLMIIQSANGGWDGVQTLLNVARNEVIEVEQGLLALGAFLA